MKKTTWIFWVLAILAIGGVAFGISGHVNQQAYHQELRNIHEKSFYELVDNLDNLEVKLAKLSVIQSKEQSALLLNDVYRQADGASQALSQLPVSHVALSDTLNFLNQLGDFTRILGEKRAENIPLTVEEEQTLTELRNTCGDLSGRLTALSANLDELDFEMARADTFYQTSDSFMGEKDTEPSIDYPTLIYDGPFSDAMQNKTPEGLSGEEIGGEEAKSIAARFLGVSEDRLVPQDGTAGQIPSFCFGTVDKGSKYVYVAKFGGQVVLMIKDRPEGDEHISLEDAASRAQAFLREQGYPEVQVAYSQRYGGAALINFVPTERNIRIYPDLIKVKVSLSDGSIVGFDAQSYYTSHKERDIPMPTLKQLDAQKLIKEGFEFRSAHLALVPKDGQEILCWEFEGSYDRDQFIIYINAETGAEENIFKVIDTGDGSLVV